MNPGVHAAGARSGQNARQAVACMTCFMLHPGESLNLDTAHGHLATQSKFKIFFNTSLTRTSGKVTQSCRIMFYTGTAK